MKKMMLLNPVTAIAGTLLFIFIIYQYNKPDPDKPREMTAQEIKGIHQDLKQSILITIRAVESVDNQFPNRCLPQLEAWEDIANAMAKIAWMKKRSGKIIRVKSYFLKSEVEKLEKATSELAECLPDKHMFLFKNLQTFIGLTMPVAPKEDPPRLE